MSSPRYVLRSGKALEGLHPQAVELAADVLEHFGGELGPMGRDALARALDASRRFEQRVADQEAERVRFRAPAPPRVGEDIRHRVAARLARAGVQS